MDSAIGFIGAGNMAAAIINGIISSKLEHKIYVYDIIPEKADRFAKQGIVVCGSIGELVESSGYIFLAVKPQNIADALAAVSRCQGLDDRIFISMAAGISTGYIASLLGAEDPKVIRIMPNTPMMLGFGATAMCHTGAVSEYELGTVHGILESCGIVCDIAEEQMDAITSINGSGPAYLFLFAKAVCDFAAEKNIEHETALYLFCQTMIGSAKMLTSSGFSPDELIKMVASPGGTTVEALKVFEERDFVDIIKTAMHACAKRAGELGK